jgi:hypothetical protein
LPGGSGQKLPQLGVGGFLVADVELDGLPRTDVVADRHRAAIGIDAHDIAN